MEEKILITCDSSADLSPELIKRYNIKVLPIVINMGNEEYLDVEDVAPDDILKFHDDTGSLATTSAPSVQQTFHFFTRFVHMGYTLIHFCLSSGLSTAYNNAVEAAEGFERVHVIDTKNASIGGALLVITAAEMLQAGKSVEEIIKECKALVPRIRIPFLVHEMEFLYKGGRASFLSNFFANIFSIKPSLRMTDGHIVPDKRYTGKFESIVPKMINDCFSITSDMDKKHLMIGHTGLSETFLQDCKSEIEKHADFKEIHIIRAGTTITCHLGKGALIFSWLSKE